MNFLDPEYIKENIAVSPLAQGGSSFETQVLYQNANHKILFKPSLGYALFCSVFALPVFVLIGIGVYKFINTQNFEFLTNNWFIVVWFIFWTAGTVFLFRTFFMPIVFDKSIDRFYKGFKKDKREQTKTSVSLSKIVALQIIGEHISGKNGTYKSFELNLVLDDLNRINVIDHGNLKGVIADANTLSQFLNVPIWHATSNKS